jgi:hypothetical protein
MAVQSETSNATVTVTAADIAEYKQRHRPVSENALVIAKAVPKDYGDPKVHTA